MLPPLSVFWPRMHTEKYVSDKCFLSCPFPQALQTISKLEDVAVSHLSNSRLCSDHKVAYIFFHEAQMSLLYEGCGGASSPTSLGHEECGWQVTSDMWPVALDL